MAEVASPPWEKTPWLIQGGMGIAISGWPLARAVSSAGQLGVVSGTAIDNVLVRQLQDWGVDDTLRGATDRFPVQSVVDEVVNRFATIRRKASAPYKSLPMLTQRSRRRSIDLIVLASFVEVALAKFGHPGIVGINLLTKVQLPTAAALCGAILAGVDYVMMGAGVPTHIPGVLEGLTLGQPVTLPLTVTGAGSDDPASSIAFDPAPYLPTSSLKRPKFIGIVSSHVLATALAKRSNGPVDGFVVERPTAGGTTLRRGGTSPSIVRATLSTARATKSTSRPSSTSAYPSGSVGASHRVNMSSRRWALRASKWALSSRTATSQGWTRTSVIRSSRRRAVTVQTSLRASSTGYPFKVVSLTGTVSDAHVYKGANGCVIWATCVRRTSGRTVQWATVALPNDSDYLRKGGSLDDTAGSACLCNGLMATCGLGQIRSGGRREPPIVTSGDRLNDITSLLAGREGYSALDVMAVLDPGVEP